MRTIGGWVVTGQLGSGGGGAVLRVRDPRTGREAALKLAAGGRALSEHEQRRFAREVEALGRLDHPGLARLLGAGTDQGRAFLVTPLVAGESLAERLRRGPLDEREAARIAREVAAALAHAHERGVLHRDLKPENVLLTPEGRPVLIDFGLAMDLDLERSRLTQTGAFLGTPGWWPPEQALGQHERVGPASDVYGVGALLYAMLTGGPPVVADSLVEMLAAATREVDPPSARRPGLDRRLDRLVARCLAREPAERFPSAAALVAALDELARPKAPSPARSPRRAPAVRPEGGAGVKVASALSAALVLVLGGAVVGGVVVARRVGPARDDAPAPAGPAEVVAPVADAPPGEVVAPVPSSVAAGRPSEGTGDDATAEDPGTAEVPGSAEVAGTDEAPESAEAAQATQVDEAQRALFARFRPDELDRRLAADPGDLEARAARAFLHATFVRVEEGEADAALVLAAPDATPGQRALAHYARGLARARRKELAEALADYDAFFASGDVHARARKERGALRLALDDPAGAVEDFTIALMQGLKPPDEASALLGRGVALRLIGLLHAARDDLSAALSMGVLPAVDRRLALRTLEGLQRELPVQDPALAEAREHIRAGRVTEARATLDARLALAPDDADALCLRGWLALDAGDPETAWRDAERAGEVRPAWGEAALLAGRARMAGGNVRGAEHPLRNAVTAMVRDPRAWRALAEWADATGDAALATRCRARAEGLPPPE